MQTPIFNFKGNPIRVDIENVHIHIRLLVEQRDMFKNSQKKPTREEESERAKLFETIVI